MTKTIGFTCGSFDLCHYGHILMLKECKGQCDHLIVGLQTNPNKDRPEKNIPIQSLEERWGQLEAIKYIDDVIVYETEDDLIQLLTDIQADIRFVGADWKGGKYTGSELDTPDIFNSRDHDYSTTNTIKQIIKKKR